MRTLALPCVMMLAGGLASAQCNRFQQDGCPPTPTNPTPTYYLQKLQANFASTYAAIAPLAKTPPVMTALNLLATDAWFASTNPATVRSIGAAIVPYTQSLASAGLKHQQVNLWLGPLSAAAEYSPGVGQTTVASDCTGGVKLAYGATPPGGSGPNCYALSYYDALFAYTSTHGITMHILGFKPTPDMVSECPIVTTGSSASVEQSWENCVEPMAVAAVTRWNSGARSFFSDWQLVGEPKAGLAGALGGIVLPIAQIHQFIVDMHTALSGATTHTMTYGAAASAQSYCGPAGPTWCTLAQSDQTYWNDWITNRATYGFSFLNLDIFASGSDLGQGGTPYAAMLASVQANFIAPALAVGLGVNIAQSQHPAYVPLGGPAGEGNSWPGYGYGSPFWSSAQTGVQDAFSALIYMWGGAYGVGRVTLHCSGPLVLYDPTPANTICTAGAGYITDLVSSAGTGVYTESGLYFAGMLNGKDPSCP